MCDTFVGYCGAYMKCNKQLSMQFHCLMLVQTSNIDTENKSVFLVMTYFQTYFQIAIITIFYLSSI